LRNLPQKNQFKRENKRPSMRPFKRERETSIWKGDFESDEVNNRLA